jgi:hypothetical protein
MNLSPKENIKLHFSLSQPAASTVLNRQIPMIVNAYSNKTVNDVSNDSPPVDVIDIDDDDDDDIIVLD